MNLNFALTLLLLTLMCGAGVVSAAYGFAIGREALRGITQPDIRPVNTLSGRKNTLPRRQEVVLLKEQDILKNVKTQIQSSEKGAEEGNRNKSLSNSSTREKSSSASTETNFPITATDKGITFEVSSVRQQSGALVLDVKLRNDGSQTVRFLYSFLNVTDEQGRVLSASTEGLPAELLPGSKNYSGTVSIPNAVLDRASKLTLALTDYPEQQLRLQASGIPIVR